MTNGVLSNFDIKQKIDDEFSKTDITLGKSGGIDIDLSEIEIDFDTGRLKYQNSNVVLFIKDHSYSSKFEKLKNGDLESGNRFHLCECSKIIEMRENNRYERYSVNANEENKFEVYGKEIIPNDGIAESGTKIVEYKDKETVIYKKYEMMETKLLVCAYCMNSLNYQNYRNKSLSEKKEARRLFNIKEYLDICKTIFIKLPDNVGQDKPNDYPDDWRKKSLETREKRDWTCVNCGVNLSEFKYRPLLHVHHINGIKNDTDDSNLKVLCVVCHANQPFHSHMKTLKNYSEQERTIRELRLTQRK